MVDNLLMTASVLAIVISTFAIVIFRRRGKAGQDLSIKKITISAATSVGFSFVGGLVSAGISVFSSIDSLSELEFSIRSAFPIFTILIALLCIMVAVYYTPRQLRIAAGATLGFLCAAYAYDGYLFVKETIEDMALQEQQN